MQEKQPSDGNYVERTLLSLRPFSHFGKTVKFKTQISENKKKINPTIFATSKDFWKNYL